MRLSTRFRILIALFLIILPVSSPAGEVPQRIISLAPSITESLYQLGAQDALIAVTSYCNYPPQAKEKEIIGSLNSPNVEKIFSLSPDLVLAINGINRPQIIEKLKGLGIKVVAFDKCNSFEDIADSFIQLGKLTGKEEEAGKILSKVEAEVERINRTVKTASPVKVFWEVGARPLVSVGDKSFASEFIRYGGGINAFSGTSMMYPRVSREEVLRKNPEVIILVTMGDVTEGEKAYWEKFRDLKAVKFNRIYVVDADKVCRPTPVSFLTGLREVAMLLHPEAFKQRNEL